MKLTPVTLVGAFVLVVGAVGFLGFATLDNSWDLDNTRVSIKSLGPTDKDGYVFLLENKSDHAIYYRGESVPDINFWISYGSEYDEAWDFYWVKGDRFGLPYQKLNSNNSIPIWVAPPPGELWQIGINLFTEPYEFSRVLSIESEVVSREEN